MSLELDNHETFFNLEDNKSGADGASPFGMAIVDIQIPIFWIFLRSMILPILSIRSIRWV